MISNQFIILLFLSVVVYSQSQDVGCFSSEATYSLCVVENDVVTVVSNNFSGEILFDECHVDFMNEIFNETCEALTTTAETTTAKSEEKKTSTAKRFGYGFLAVFVISVLSVVGLLAVPCIHKSIFQYILAAFTALAVGTLFGDAMFHLIPFMVGLHSHSDESTTTVTDDHSDHDHRILRRATHDHTATVLPYQWKLFAAVMVLYGFYLLEVLLRALTNLCTKKNVIHTHSHNHSHAMPARPRTANVNRKGSPNVDKADVSIELEDHRKKSGHQHNYNELDPSLTCVYKDCPHHHKGNNSDSSNPVDSHSSQNDDDGNGPSKISSATGWMVILGDGIHNIADGLAIGAAFSESYMLGLTTTIAVGCHELPHELGDYAVLLQAGFSRCGALIWNFISAATAFVGFFIGAAVSTGESVRQWIFAITAGMFLYIALVDLLPTLLPEGRINWKRFICVNVGYLVGIAIMFLLAIYEEKLLEIGS